MRIVILLFAVLFLTACQQNSGRTLTDIKDYDHYLDTSAASTTSKYFELWNSKIKPDSMQLSSFGIVAGEYNRYFNATGDIQFLKKAEMALKRAVNIAAIGKAEYLRALARNYITQHRFKEALQLASAACRKGSGINSSHKLMFDIHMELGNYNIAGKYLDSVKNMSDFGYLIRIAKWNDHKGDLSTTIRFMEKAKEKAEAAKNKSLQLWSYTNLADYYGHAGRIKASYQHFLQALSLDPNNAYAKKGIAWIVFSHGKNPKEAMRILDAVTKNYKSPDYYLLKAEIAEYMNDDRKYLSNLDNYYKTVQNPQYGPMYNIPNAVLYLDQTAQYKKGIKLARKEVNNRPTPETFALLAYAYLKDGQNTMAAKIADNEILGKTFEPNTLLYAAEIYKAVGKAKTSSELKAELLDAVYELGPVQQLRIYKL